MSVDAQRAAGQKGLMQPGHDNGSDNSNTAVYLFMGCAGFLLLMLCVASGGLFYFASQRVGDMSAGGAPTSGPSGAPGGAPSVGPAQPAAPQSPPVRIRATITQVMGTGPAPISGTCEVEITTPGSNPPCHANVVCAGQLLYGGPNQGYFPCEISPPPNARVVGRDDQTNDGDAAFSIDTTAGQVTVHDGPRGQRAAYSITARVASID